MKNRNRIALGITGAVLAGALAVGQLAPAAFADDKETTLTVTETETDAPETEEAAQEQTEEKKVYEQLDNEHKRCTDHSHRCIRSRRGGHAVHRHCYREERTGG